MPKQFDEILSENISLSESDRSQIMEAWTAQLTEAREQLTAELREEFAQKFEHDKSVMVESVENFLEGRLQVEMEELAEDKKQLAKARVDYKRKIAEHAALLDKFMMQQLAKEVKEFHSERQGVKENVRKLEDFVLKQLSEEIKDFHADKQALAEQRVKMVTEGKAQLVDTKKQFIGRASKVIEENINKVLRKEIAQYRDDIKAARENDFGRRIFESFVGEYMTSYLNEGTQVSKLNQVINNQKAQTAALEEMLTKQQTVTEGVERKLKASQDRLSRDKKFNELLAPLAKDKREIMGELLESVKTENLDKAFNKYLPAVLSESKPKKVVKQNKLNESVKTDEMKSEKTGDRARTTLNEGEDQQLALDLQKLKNLAGIK